MATVAIAPDSFKGSIDAVAAASALRAGWLASRPDDTVVVLPQADGGEGTLEAVLGAVAGAELCGPVTITGPDGRLAAAPWVRLPDGTAVVELARAAGLPMMARPDPLGASTKGLGEVISHVLDAEPSRLLIGLGGSASTDGAAAAFAALGLRLIDEHGALVPGNGGSLARLATVDDSALRPPPPGGVQLLSDVSSPLLGPAGAAAVFAPQKGANPQQVGELEAGLARWAAVLEAAGRPPRADTPGAGAAGGAGYGFMALWGAQATSGAAHVARVTGLDDAVATADVLITGEGQFDATSMTGKVVGHALELARLAGTPAVVVAGALAADPTHMAAAGGNNVEGMSLTAMAGSSSAALAQPERWLIEAGSRAAAAHTAQSGSGGR
ncbi:MAG: glycerate kinase [Demequina sp.]